MMKRTSVTGRVLKIVLPAGIVLIILIVSAVGGVVYRLTHPKPSPIDINPVDYQELAQEDLHWSSEKWQAGDGQEVHGWLLRTKPTAPVVIMSHGAGQTRSDLLRLGVRLWASGYNVLLYDLRGHGESSVGWSGLGQYEADDLVSGIKSLKNFLDDKGQPLVDSSRIGLYGVGVGGYATLLAASQVEGVRGILVDSVYADIPQYVHGQLKEMLSMNNRTSDYLIGLGLDLYLGRKGNSLTAAQAVRSYQRIPLLMFTSNDAGELRLSTGDVFTQALQPKEMREMAHSRLGRLYGTDAQEYDKAVLDFFKRTDVLPVK